VGTVLLPISGCPQAISWRTSGIKKELSVAYRVTVLATVNTIASEHSCRLLEEVVRKGEGRRTTDEAHLCPSEWLELHHTVTMEKFKGAKTKQQNQVTNKNRLMNVIRQAVWAEAGSYEPIIIINIRARRSVVV
jgi:hypothetical protein